MPNNPKGHLWFDWSDSWDCRDSKGCILTKDDVLRLYLPLHHNSKYQRICEKSCCVLNMKWSHLQSLRFSLYKGYQMHFSIIICEAPQESTAAWLFGLSGCLSSSFGKVKADRSRRPIQNQDVMQVMEDTCTMVAEVIVVNLGLLGWSSAYLLVGNDRKSMMYGEQKYQQEKNRFMNDGGSMAASVQSSKKSFHIQLKKSTFVRKKC